MDLKDLRIFRRVAESGSLHRAAETLGLTQPALTKSVRRLEASLGAHLFERTARGVSLTASGKVLYARSQELLKAADDIPRELNDLRMGKADQLRLGTVPSLVDHVICPALVQSMQAQVPASFSVHIHLTGTLLRDLAAGHLDMALTTLQDDAPPELACTLLGPQRSFFVTRAGHPLQGRRFERHELLDYPWMLTRNDVTLNQWLTGIFKGLGLPPPPRLYIETDAAPIALAAWLASTDAITLLTEDSLATEGAAGLAPLPLDVDQQPLQVALCWRRSAYFSTSMRHLRQQVVRAYAARPAAQARR